MSAVFSCVLRKTVVLTLGLLAVRLAFFSLAVLAVLTRAFLRLTIVFTLGVAFAVIITLSHIALSLALTVLGATGTVAAVVVALTAVFLARRVITTAGTRCRADGAATGRTVAAVTTVATVCTIATVTTITALTTRGTASIEAPGGGRRSSGPLSKTSVFRCRLKAWRVRANLNLQFLAAADAAVVHLMVSVIGVATALVLDKGETDAEVSSVLGRLTCQRSTHSLLEEVRGAGMSQRTRRP